jgi:hypothetical protein
MPLPILLAQKFHCILKRKRSMGRDFYDAVFLLGKTKASKTYLEQKLGILSADDLKNRLIEKCSRLNLDVLSHDVEPFLIFSKDAGKITLFPDLIGQIEFDE